jgi:hypothetical protein
LAGFINDLIIPMLDGLSSTIQPTPSSTPNGLEGRFIYSDTTDTTPVFFDDLADTPNTIADSFRVISGIVQAVQTSVSNLNVEVTALQAALSTTNQNDVSQALQNFAAALESLTAQVNANTAAIAAISVSFLTNGVANGTQNILDLTAGTGISLVDGAGGVVTIASTVEAAALQTNGTPNSTQTLLNLAGTSDISLVEVAGTVTFTYTGPGGGSSPFDVPVFAPGLGSNNQKLLRLRIARHVTFSAGAANSYATASAAATGSTTYTFSQNGTPFATVNYAATSSAGIFTQAADANFVPGDLLEIYGPATADTTLADVGITFYGTRTS